MTSIIVQGVIFQPFRQFVGDWAAKIQERQELKAQGADKIPRRSVVAWFCEPFIEWFDKLVNCAQCTGFWCGLFCGLFFVSSNCLTVGLVPPGWKGTGLPLLHYLLMWFCCGLGGSFLSALGCNVIDWVFYRKMNALRQLEEQDLMLAERQAHLPEMHEPVQE
jgi:hypothetical protein